MSTITPLIDTLMHQVLGRRAQMERVASEGAENKVLSVNAIRGDQSLKPGQEHLNRPQQPEMQVASPRQGAAQRAGAEAGLYERLQPATSDAARAAPSSLQFRFTREGQTLSTLLSQFGDVKTSVPARTPALITQPGVPASPSAMAEGLRQTVGQSGIFYESHLSRWFKGDFPEQLLRQEPQGRLPLLLRAGGEGAPLPGAPAAQPGAPMTTTGAAVAGQVHPSPGMPGATPPPTVGSATMPFGAGAADMAPGPAAASARSGAETMARGDVGSSPVGTEPRQIIHESVQRLVSHQLETLTTHTLRIDAQLTPQVPLLMEITELRPLPDEDALYMDEREAHQADDDEASRWRSTLSLELPRLGAVQFDLLMNDGALSIACRTDQAQTAGRFREARVALQQAMSEIGLSTQRIDIERLTREEGHE
ncbi:flagellar hook-length control protein FliK [Larsenimonas rhizosphaerae]|uniref:Flagellar hook-length control protein FliK n=1 Tax=Larsenimonas rhizosphaerae TaxID=2944682 RepID=A0AA41ZCI3_9GAMM|nr:flagellar hook-length control protein FliK [Larsenimonas rhizosphaerae]MCX2522797.1 flagellar hook-length control protein FliK [Larsenimonas rhizosphaerae]